MLCGDLEGNLGGVLGHFIYAYKMNSLKVNKGNRKVIVLVEAA